MHGKRPKLIIVDEFHLTDDATIRALAALAAPIFGTTQTDILSPQRRNEAASRARQAIYYACNIALGWQDRRIARAFGRRHSTIQHGLRVIEDRRDTPAFDARILTLEHAASALGAVTPPPLRKAA